MDPSEWEVLPSYYDLILALKEFLNNRLREATPASVELTFNSLDLLLVFTSAVVWTYLRQLITERILKPLGTRCALTSSNQLKMPESGWKFGYYLCAWSFNCYILILSGDYKFFQRPSSVWDGWSLHESLPKKMYFFYITQEGFYLHSLYATIFMDTWRKDSILMIFHHTSTLILIALSFSLRCHNIGCVVLFLHDVCDIFLESSKLNVYFKIQNNKVVKLHEVLANISFLCFTVVWYVSRLYWYPLGVLYTGISNVNGLQSKLPCSLLMNSLLWMLQILNIYWFYLILQTLFRVATGQLQEDAREYDVEERLREEKQNSTVILKGKSLQNGAASDSENVVTSDRKEN